MKEKGTGREGREKDGKGKGEGGRQEGKSDD